MSWSESYWQSIVENDEIEYSEQIKYFDWPWPEWRLDRDEEDQLKADVDEALTLRDYLVRRKGHGSKSFTA